MLLTLALPVIGDPGPHARCCRVVTSQVHPSLIRHFIPRAKPALPSRTQRRSARPAEPVVRLAPELPRVLQMRFQSPRVTSRAACAHLLPEHDRAFRKDNPR